MEKIGRDYYCSGPYSLSAAFFAADLYIQLCMSIGANLKRAEGPAVYSHARKGVVQDTDNVEGRRPGTRPNFGANFFTPAAAESIAGSPPRFHPLHNPTFYTFVPQS